MKREVIENLNEKDFVASLIMSDLCCQVLIPHIKINYFECDYSRTIVSWIMDYYNKFKRSPKSEMMAIYRTRCDEIQDEALKDLVFEYLKNISEADIQINNEEYLLDRSRDYLDYQRMKDCIINIDSCLETRSMDKARKIFADYDKISVAATNEVDFLAKSDMNIIKEALAKQEEVLMTMPGALNDVIGNIHRNDFIAILAPAKKGKSWFLQQIAIEAMKQQLNVVYISMEMTREEVIQRLCKTLFGAKSGLVKPGLYETAKFVEDTSEQGKYRFELTDAKVSDKTPPSIDYLFKQLRASTGYKGNIHVIAYPAYGASVQEITDRVEDLARKGFVADVICLDYGDITKPIGGGTEVRNQLDLIWKHLRGFSMKFHCAVFTASQTNRSGFNSSVVDASAISEDIRKVCHCTSMVSMEQTSGMKNKHIMRIRNIAMRNGEAKDTCVFPQCLALGQFIFGEPIPGNSLILDDDNEENSD